MSISVTKLFGLQGDRWMRHANPVSVWTRFAVLPLVALVLVFMMVDPLLFPPPRSTRNWASKGVSGLLITQVAKAWFIDRMVLLYEDMKARDPEYAGWER